MPTTGSFSGPRYLKWVKATTAVSRGQPLLWGRFPDTFGLGQAKAGPWPWGSGKRSEGMGPRLPLAAILGRRAPKARDPAGHKVYGANPHETAKNQFFYTVHQQARSRSRALCTGSPKNGFMQQAQEVTPWVLKQGGRCPRGFQALYSFWRLWQPEMAGAGDDSV